MAKDDPVNGTEMMKGWKRNHDLREQQQTLLLEIQKAETKAAVNLIVAGNLDAYGPIKLNVLRSTCQAVKRKGVDESPAISAAAKRQCVDGSMMTAQDHQDADEQPDHLTNIHDEDNMQKEVDDETEGPQALGDCHHNKDDLQQVTLTEPVLEPSMNGEAQKMILSFLDSSSMDELDKSLLIHINQHNPSTTLLDLTTTGNACLQIPEDMYKTYLDREEAHFAGLIPDHVKDFLAEFFDQDRTETQWHLAIEELSTDVKHHFVHNAAIRVIKNAVPNFGEIPTHTNNRLRKGDGIALTDDEYKSVLFYVEGSRPNIKNPANLEAKKRADRRKIVEKMQYELTKRVEERVTRRARTPAGMKVFGGLSVGTMIYFFVMDYQGIWRLRDVDSAAVPKTIAEFYTKMRYLVEAVLMLAMSIKQSEDSLLEEDKKKGRTGRKTNALELRKLREIEALRQEEERKVESVIV
ncbi:hypothetical protein HK097_003327 [Rhizophlyctis rosea]|uniref:Uncharacterized protein n=1 Tax=Rhizophlyctis rosea TaxID=64517 RepID=A0AAD5SI72_9FUNG|nr:hypothetical protein HK097_003327 [Rhizophlyctis rosea]